MSANTIKHHHFALNTLLPNGNYSYRINQFFLKKKGIMEKESYELVDCESK